MKKGLLLGIMLAAGQLAYAQTAVDTLSVAYSPEEPTTQGFFAKPTGTGPFPAVVVIQEWWGLNDQIKDMAKKMAEAGYAVLAVDLYRGSVTKDPAEAHELMRGLPEDRALRNLQAAFQFLYGHSSVQKNKIGSIGWCMGGGYSLRLAAQEPRLAACVVNYGSLITDSSVLAKIQAPVLGSFGGEDKGITPKDVKEFEKSMRKLGKKVDIKIYPKAGHAFCNPNNPGYRPDDAADAWKRALTFFDKNLKH